MTSEKGRPGESGPSHNDDAATIPVEIERTTPDDVHPDAARFWRATGYQAGVDAGYQYAQYEQTRRSAPVRNDAEHASHRLRWDYYAQLLEEHERQPSAQQQARAVFDEAVRTGDGIVEAWRAMQVARRLDQMRIVSLHARAGRPLGMHPHPRPGNFAEDLTESLARLMNRTPEVAALSAEWDAGAAAGAAAEADETGPDTDGPAAA